MALYNFTVQHFDGKLLTVNIQDLTALAKAIPNNPLVYYIDKTARLLTMEAFSEFAEHLASFLLSNEPIAYKMAPPKAQEKIKSSKGGDQDKHPAPEKLPVSNYAFITLLQENKQYEFE